MPGYDAEKMLGLLREIPSASAPRDHGIVEHQRRAAAQKNAAVAHFFLLGGEILHSGRDVVAELAGIVGRAPIRRHPRDCWFALAAWREMAILETMREDPKEMAIVYLTNPRGEGRLDSH